MEEPQYPENERERMETLRALEILDTPPEERFDRVTRLARRLFEVPIALVSLVDETRQWFKSAQGIEATETPREVSFCGHAICENQPFVIPDASQDVRFVDNPLVTEAPNIRFYAGQPLSIGEDCRLGTLCLIDRVPRTMSSEDLQLLKDLAVIVEEELLAVRAATLDTTTGLSNRRGFEVVARQALSICERMKKDAAVLFLDLDEFKQINDRLGHSEGDRALRDVGTILKETFRASDVVARFGGDEFCVFLNDVRKVEIDDVLVRLRWNLDQHTLRNDRPYRLDFSVGRAFFNPKRHDNLDDLLSSADKNMYAQKRANKAEQASQQRSA